MLKRLVFLYRYWTLKDVFYCSLIFVEYKEQEGMLEPTTLKVIPI